MELSSVRSAPFLTPTVERSSIAFFVAHSRDIVRRSDAPQSRESSGYLFVRRRPRRSADRRHRPHLRVRLRARIRYPRQGKGPHSAVGLLVRRDKRHRSESLRSTRPEDYPAAAREHRDALRGRSMLVRKTEPFPIECVARGYLSGSGWKEYQSTGTVCGVKLPDGLRESDRLPEPIFTPATKATTGPRHQYQRRRGRQDRRSRHDRKAPKHDAAAVLARRRPRRTPGHHRRRHEIRIRARLRRQRHTRKSSSLTRCSRRIRPASGRGISTSPEGRSRASTSSSCAITSKQSAGTSSRPVPSLPPEVIEKTREKYVQAFRVLTGLELD